MATLPSQVDVVHGNGVVRDEICRALPIKYPDIAIGMEADTWANYLARHGFSAPTLAVDLECTGPESVVLMVRRMARADTRVVVFGTPLADALRQRLLREGALAWIGPESSLDQACYVLAMAARQTGAREVTLGKRDLSDRELEVATRFAGPDGPTIAMLGRALGLEDATIRSHLRSARRKLRGPQTPVHNRATLTATLIATGYLPVEDPWHNW